MCSYSSENGEQKRRLHSKIAQKIIVDLSVMNLKLVSFNQYYVLIDASIGVAMSMSERLSKEKTANLGHSSTTCDVLGLLFVLFSQ